MKSRSKINKPPILFTVTQKLLATIEKRVGATVIAYWDAPNGSVCHDDVQTFYSLLRHMGPQKRLALFIKSDGGNGTASLRIIHLLRQYCEHLTVLVPLNCMSAATMIALGADEIRMGALAYLSAVDTSLTHDLSPVDINNNRVSISLDELSRIINLWRKESKEEGPNPYSSIFNHIHPLVIGAVDRSSSLSIRLCREILSYHMTDRKKAEKISKMLNADYPWHSYPITIKEAHRVGLNAVSLDQQTNDLLLEMHTLYSEMGQRAVTDFDERNYHDNEILNIIEGRGLQFFFQSDKKWHYRTEERRWISMNDNSSWRRIEKRGGKIAQTVFHIR
ncbi:MAG: SDH family Clp fold serine proteinase [Blastocatellia bacterium]